MRKNNLPYPWVESDIPIVTAARGFSDLAEHTLKVIARVGKPVVMVSGPISTGGKGSRDENIKNYAKAIEYLRMKKIPVFDQVLIESLIGFHAKAWQEKGNTGYCIPILEDLYKPIFRSGLVGKLMFMPDWQTSFGSRWERKTAAELAIDIEDFPPNWEEEFAATTE